MHYFQLPVKTQPDGPSPSDTDLRSFATEYFASWFRNEEDIPREARLPKVRQLESEFLAVSGRALWQLVLKRVDELPTLSWRGRLSGRVARGLSSRILKDLHILYIYMYTYSSTEKHKHINEYRQCFWYVYSPFLGVTPSLGRGGEL